MYTQAIHQRIYTQSSINQTHRSKITFNQSIILRSLLNAKEASQKKINDIKSGIFPQN